MRTYSTTVNQKDVLKLTSGVFSELSDLYQFIRLTPKDPHCRSSVELYPKKRVLQLCCTCLMALPVLEREVKFTIRLEATGPSPMQNMACQINDLVFRMKKYEAEAQQANRTQQDIIRILDSIVSRVQKQEDRLNKLENLTKIALLAKPVVSESKCQQTELPRTPVKITVEQAVETMPRVGDLESDEGSDVSVISFDSFTEKVEENNEDYTVVLEAKEK